MRFWGQINSNSKELVPKNECGFGDKLTLITGNLPIKRECGFKRVFNSPSVLHTPSVLGVSSTFRTAITESIAVLAVEILRVLGVWTVLKGAIQTFYDYFYFV